MQAGFFIVLAYLLLFTLFFIVVFKATFARSIAPAYILMGILMSLTSLLTNKLSTYSVIINITSAILGIITLIFIIIKIKNKEIKDILKRYFSLAFFIFIIFYSYLFLLNSNMELSNIDDLGYRSIATLEALRVDSWHPAANISVARPLTFPPLSNYLQAIFILLFKEGNQQSILLFSSSSFSISFLMPLLDRFEFKKKDIIKILLSLIIIISLIISIQNNHYMMEDSFITNSLYVDWLLGLELAYMLYLVYRFDYYNPSDYLFMIMAGYALVETKAAGVALLIIPLIALYFKSGRDQKIPYYLIIATVLIITGIIALTALINIIPNNKYIQTLIELSKDISTFSDNYTVQNFIRACIEDPIIHHPFTLSWLPLIICLTIAMTLAIYLNKNHGRGNYVIPILYFIGSFGYAIVVLSTFLYQFAPEEGETLAMYGCYMQSYTYAGYVTVFYILFAAEKKMHILKIELMTIISLLFVEPNGIDSIIYNANREYPYDYEISKMTDYFKKDFDHMPVIVFNATDMEYRAKIRYNLLPYYQYIDYSFVPKNLSGDFFKQLIADYRYVLIGDADKNLSDAFYEAAGFELIQSSLYRIDVADGEVYISYDQVWESEE